MKKIFLIFVCFAFSETILIAQETHVINVSGSTFSPSVLNIQIGDSVQFNSNSSHPVLEVSESTYNSNENTPLSGGFYFSDGVGKISYNVASTHYYVCEIHYALGMKGKIIFSAPTSIKNQNLYNGINLYPNPLNQDKLTIYGFQENDMDIQVKIFDLTRRSRYNTLESTQNNSIIIESATIPSGIYFVQIGYKNTIQNYKLIKIK